MIDAAARRRIFLGMALCLAVQCAAPGAIAQSGNDDEIIVTARKSEENAQRVPAAPLIIGRRELENRQVNDLLGVAALTPGLILGAAPLEVGTEVSLRGIGSSPLDPGVDQSVALNIDGLPLGQGAAYSASLFDMERIEILKGPQPLFFGKNSPGGVIAIRTADPGDVKEAIGSAAYEAEAREWQARLILSGPVTETLKLRLASQYGASDGYFRNAAIARAETGAVQPDARFGARHSLYLRLSGLFEPSPDFTARLKLNATHDRSRGGLQEQLVFCPDGTANYLPQIGLPIPSMFSANEDCKADRELAIVDLDPNVYQGLPNSGVSFTDSDQRFGTLEMSWAVTPQIRLTSVTGYYHLKIDALQNGPWSGGAAPPLAIIKAFQREELTQELRLAYDLGGPFDFVAGAFFQDAGIDSDIRLAGNRLYGLPPVALQGSHEIDIRALALFGQLRFRPTPQFEISSGVRWTDEKRSNQPVTYDVLGVFTGVQGTPLELPQPRLHSGNWSPELTVAWFPTDDLTLFGSFKQGYKSGSYNINLPLNPGDDLSFGDERGRGGEVGIKGYAAGRQLAFDLTGYSYRYSGLQVGIVRITSAGIPTLATVNAASAKIHGLDMTLRYRPRAVAGLSIKSTLNWNRASFTRFANAGCYPGQTVAEGCNLQPSPVTNPNEIAAGYFSVDRGSGMPVRYNAQNLSGRRLHRAPSWQGLFSVDYERPLGTDLLLGLGAQVQYSSRYVVDLLRRENNSQGAYAKIGASIRIAPRDKRWELALIGNNLGNRLTTGGCLDINYPGGGGVFPGAITGAPIRGPAGSGEILCGYERGREVWLRLTVRPFDR